ICINTCQLNTSCNINDTQPVYFLRRLRNHEEFAQQAEDCLMCGRCENACPVGINLNAIRQSKRPDILRVTKDTYAYVPQPEVNPAKVAYFAGCMSHLTPGIIKSMQQIFEKAKADYTFIDEKAGVCCGRPLALSGNWKAHRGQDKNLPMIETFTTGILVTSSDLLQAFKEDYLLNIKSCTTRNILTC
ncbi:MAG: 4Fe-4S dicluster domain-containing protein, partial [Butyricimonas faecihominis]